jgi:hypothetical protein
MSKTARWSLALLVGATLAVPAAAQVARREGRTPLVVNRPEALADGPLLVVERPSPGQTVSGVVAVSGWVLNVNPIDKIELFIDDNDVPVNQAVLNLPRADISAAFPAYAPSNQAPGWITSFLAKNYLDGTHNLFLSVTEQGQTVPLLFGPIEVVINNEINQAPFGHIDLPTASPTVSANGPLPVLGWALDDSDVDHIDFLVDNIIVATAVGRGGVGNATFGATRPDIYAAFPDFPGPAPKSLYSGFLAEIDSTRFVDGMHTVSVRVYDDQGASQEIGSVEVQVMNNGGLLAPFGQIDYPLDESTIICGPVISVTPPTGGCPSPCFPGTGGGVPVSSFPNLVRGWALDTGVRLDRGQVSYVELMLDGSILANTRIDCTIAGTTAVANCYGLSRPDIASLYQGYVNSANSGFQFNFAVSRDALSGLFGIFIPTPQGTILAGYTLPGKHTLSVRVGDEEETVTEWGAMSVYVTCDGSNPDRASFGTVDSPTEEQFINGAFQVFGWASDLDGGVKSVDLAVDGTVIVNLNPVNGGYGIRRDDVLAKDLRVGTPFVGFAYVLDTLTLGDTEHDLTVYANDALGHRTLIGRRKFVVYNNTSTKQ